MRRNDYELCEKKSSFLLFGAAALVYTVLVGVGESSEGIIIGLISGFGVTGILGIISSLKLMKNPKRCAEIELCKTEERYVFIREKTNSTVYSIFNYIESIAVIVAVLLGYTSVSICLSFLLLGKIILWSILAYLNGEKY